MKSYWFIGNPCTGIVIIQSLETVHFISFGKTESTNLGNTYIETKELFLISSTFLIPKYYEKNDTYQNLLYLS